MRYADKLHGFAFTLSDDWKRLRRWLRFFWAILGMEDPDETWVRFARKGHPGYIDLSVGPAATVLVSPQTRADALRQWFVGRPELALEKEKRTQLVFSSLVPPVGRNRRRRG